MSFITSFPQRLLRRAFVRLDAAMNRLYGWRLNPLYQSGAIAIAMLLVLIVTGTYLLLFYRIGSPYASVARITEQVWLGRWIRSLHRFSSDALLVATAVHALRMFAQRRTWGPRVLAWVSGLVLVFVIFVCGWTGYVLVWDAQAHLLASAGARLMDVLPIFSEPISRTFVGERPMPNAFFFINFFLHVALPLGLGLILWIHVARVARPVLLPSRKTGWSLTGLLIGASLLWPIGMSAEADLLRIPPSTEVDAFYGFWLPLEAGLSPGAMWAGFGLVTLALLAVPWLTRPAPAARPSPSFVDERSCTGCEQCYHDCPYEAISMVERSDGRAGMVARVDPALCVSCGICAGSCAPMVVGPPGRSGRDQIASLRSRLSASNTAPGQVVLIACDKGAGGLARAPHDDLPNTRLHPISCVGSLHSSVIEFYLRAGAAGVMVVACPQRDCWNREGGKWAEQRVLHGREAELQERVDRDRVHLTFAAEGERGRVLTELEAFRSRLQRTMASDDVMRIDLVELCERAPDDEQAVDPILARDEA